ncbi:MAG: hypothetical protein DRI71_08245 [Bacteroidetes bacterium]|nr:MAG: hypothetical protein DRI71_08245 [Bacteroidota bacterium]
MKTTEIINRIEEIIDSENMKSEDSKTESQGQSGNSTIKDILYLILDFFLTILKTPFNFFAKYLKKEIITTIKNDAKIYALIMGIMGVLFVFFSVLWLFISVAIGIYFYESGYSIFMSMMFSIGFQLISFLIVVLVARIASKRIKSFVMFNNFKELVNSEIE